MSDVVTIVTYQLERPDGTVLYRQMVPSYLYIEPRFNPDPDGALDLGDWVVWPPWRVRVRIGPNGEWQTLYEQAEPVATP